MIEAAAAPVSEETTIDRPVPSEASRQVDVMRRPLLLALGWLLFTAVLAWFIFAGSVRVGAGHWLGQRLRVRIIWMRYLDFLSDHGASPLVVGLVAVAAVLTLLGSLAMLWWVLGRGSGDAEPPVAPDVS